jgi:hypothetical protein
MANVVPGSICRVVGTKGYVVILDADIGTDD